MSGAVIVLTQQDRVWLAKALGLAIVGVRWAGADVADPVTIERHVDAFLRLARVLDTGDMVRIPPRVEVVP